MSFHSNSTKEAEEDKHMGGLSRDQQIIYEILKKRNRTPRKSWFGFEKEKKDVEHKLGNFHIGNNGSEGDIKIEKMEEEII